MVLNESILDEVAISDPSAEGDKGEWFWYL